jgi:hypothetical protein
MGQNAVILVVVQFQTYMVKQTPYLYFDADCLIYLIDPSGSYAPTPGVIL